MLVPWAAVDPGATLSGVAVTRLIADLPSAERAGVELAAQVHLR